MSTQKAAHAGERTTSLGIIVFPGYQPLDVWGPLDIFYSLSRYKKLSLAIIAKQAGPISSRVPSHSMSPGGPIQQSPSTLAPKIVATHSFDDAPALDIILVPGGGGNRLFESTNDTSIEDFVSSRYPELQYLLSVCTGAATLARAGLLEGRRATSNKASWNWVIQHGKNVTWVPTARWVVDGNIWTSSGVAAGLDMTYAFLKHYYGENDQEVKDTMNAIEYAPHTDPHWDPFSIVHKVPGADASGSLSDVTKPAGY
ncbi:class I glutamine amidotransferase-like protein [Podospora didyma]|uniref:Class I glutamine amidotransferase-like protein n=1 Tax=Podospora didyma TaxID=330526 RepID=A0AAE0U0A5_9PEZI|nr:class I glutamine amidotransferase-like protein [Podospora didyma]